MTTKVDLKRFSVYVYNIRDEAEGQALARILESRLENGGGRLKNNKIDAWQLFDADRTYHHLFLTGGHRTRHYAYVTEH